MRKVVIHEPGDYDVLRLEEHPDPEPRPGEVLVEAQAMGVNYADSIVRMGLYESARKYVGFPITPGFEVAGRVLATGSEAADLSPGTEVFGVTRFGGYATRLCIPRHQVFEKPARLNTQQAAAFPTVFLTAWYALVELCRLRPGMRVLVHSAAGGVGGALVQIAKIHSAFVVGVVGASHKVETAQRLGADAVIDKSQGRLWTEARRHSPDGYDIVLDANGVATLRRSYRSVKPAGRLVIYGFHSMMSKSKGRPNYLKLAADYLRTPRFNPIEMTNENRSVLAFNLSYLFERTDLLNDGMRDLLGWLDSGQLSSLPIEAVPFDQVQHAHRRIETGQTVGKLVLVA